MNEQQPLMGSHSRYALTPEETHEVSGGQFFNEPLNTNNLPNFREPQDRTNPYSGYGQINGGGNNRHDMRYNYEVGVKRDFDNGFGVRVDMRGNQEGVQGVNARVKKDF